MGCGGRGRGERAGDRGTLGRRCIVRKVCRIVGGQCHWYADKKPAVIVVCT